MKPSNSSEADFSGGEWLPRAWRRATRPWVQWTLAAMAVAGLSGLFLAAAVSRHYAHEAEKFDLAGLQHLMDGTQVMDRNGQFVGTLFADGRKFIRVDEAPQCLIDAVLATEDSRFYQHRGVDYRGMVRAALANGFGPVRQGASTLTQQLARQAFGLRGRTYDRKLTEIFLARRIEKHYTKQEILGFYLNHVYLGSGFYGVGSAARGYFGKEVRDLTLEESAVLAGIIKSPVRCSPFDAPTEAARVRNLTLRRMVAVGKLSPEGGRRALGEPITVLPRQRRHAGPDYLLAAAERTLRNGSPQLEGMVKRRVRLTIDGDLQKAATERLTEQLEKAATLCSETAGRQLQGAAVILANDTGEILAAVGGRNFRESPFDRALVGRWPAGTAFLPLTHAAAHTVSPDLASQRVLDAPLDNRQVMLGGRSGTLGEWAAENEANEYEGWMSPSAALTGGKTGASVRLGFIAGFDRLRERLGLCQFSQPLRPYPATMLGVTPVRPLELAQAYAAIANRGVRPAAAPLVAAVDAGGLTRTLDPVQPAIGVFSTPAADTVREAMVAHLDRPEFAAERRRTGLESARLAGYGGTAYGFTHAWFAGSDARVTCVVWIGTDTGVRLGRPVWARQLAFPLWCDLMAAATHGKPLGFPEAAPVMANHPTPSATGRPGTAAGPSVQMPTRINGPATVRAAEPVVVGDDPYRPVPVLRTGLVMRAEPAGSR